ncbi:2'-5' RNA ligase family protein [Gordonia sp. NPDC003504]
MAHSVEFLLDDTSDQRIRHQWAALADAGLPNQASIRSSTNRPHVTAIAAGHIASGIDAALSTVAMRLPFPASLGGIVVFGDGHRRVVARLVVPTTELLSMHSAIVRLGSEHATSDGHESGLFDHCRPGHWTPHVTLARRVEVEAIPDVLRVLGTVAAPPDAPTTITALRRWDPDTVSEHIVGGRAC